MRILWRLLYLSKMPPFTKTNIRKKGRKSMSLQNILLLCCEHDIIWGFLSMQIVPRTRFQNFNLILYYNTIISYTIVMIWSTVFSIGNIWLKYTFLGIFIIPHELPFPLWKSYSGNKIGTFDGWLFLDIIFVEDGT